MRPVFGRFVVIAGMLTLACATALEEGPLNGSDDDNDDVAGSGGSLAVAGAGSLAMSGSSSAGTSTASNGGKGGTGPSAFGGTAASGGAGGGKGGGSSGGSAGAASGGAAAGGKGGSATAGSANGGSGGSGISGSASGGGGSAGSSSTTCDGVPDWTSKTYATGDTVASTCSGVFAGACSSGQAHKFECNPIAGAAALPWCQSREPGVGNGWAEAWVDKGQCQ